MIYLASQSHRRRVILTQMKIPFCVVPSEYRERRVNHLGPVQLVLRHAKNKAKRAVLPKKARYVLGADTVVWCRGKILGKPKTWKEAGAMLRLISGRSHEVYTGLALWDRRSGKWRLETCRTKVSIKKLSSRAIEAYLKKISPFDKAGSYAIQKHPKIVRKIEGSYSNVVGLPRELLRKLI